MKSSFAHLRVSSEYSIFKGLLSVEKLVEKAKSFGMPAIALTDHSNMFGLVKFFKKCEKEGIKPISCLLYTSPSPRDCRLSRMPSSA